VQELAGDGSTDHYDLTDRILGFHTAWEGYGMKIASSRPSGRCSSMMLGSRCQACSPMDYAAAIAAIRERRRKDTTLATWRAKRDLRIIRASKRSPGLTGPELAARFGLSKGWVPPRASP
jgi:hypothetical protein